ncbi:aromatic ring-hydroxylating dioxygenase subunit alpha (plasmid) [Paraburkholderia sprentiae WSM5005]|uniref:Aromatic ring-hydroxylating dioxygenase subunit alpha n=1 Tax=Paraburkholderia sprentiae WSM5005 TaxID=754502 RepID=A0A1I9YWB8_9BURK|nr:aromatic ring-hydroxylating dioxygenase subunit alpha [Paraburkholderia sprentiae]APA90523.2 aromatic ring-hydroxylating dioxygenase subunit alpha [Paraburkholderia sprentiae WSM5005]
MNVKAKTGTVLYPETGPDGLPLTPLTQEFYTSELWYERDIEIVFSRRWLFVCHISELPNSGDYTTFELGKISIIVSRGQTGEVHAFHNVCRHRGTRLREPGKGNARVFTCQFHAWSYNTDGTLRLAPHMPDLDKACYNAKSVWSEVWNGMIFVNLQTEKPKSVADYLQNADVRGHRLESAKVIAKKDYVTKANWKINGETFQECYHCGIVHKATLGNIINPITTYTAYDDVAPVAGNDMEYMIFSDNLTEGQFAPGVKTETMDGQFVTKRLMGDGPEPQAAKLLSWFPNFSVGAWPDFAVVVDWIPVSAQETLFRTRWLVHADAVEGVDYDVDTVIELTDLANIEDKKIVELQQQGVNSPAYIPGPYQIPLEDYARKYIAHYLAMVKEVGTWSR